MTWWPRSSFFRGTLTVAAIAALAVSCSQNQAVHRHLQEESHSHAAMAAPVVRDAVPLPSQAHPTMQQIALTFPLLDFPLDDFKDDEGAITEGPNHWQLYGDGAQTSFKVERLSLANDPALKVAVTVGPVFDGFGFRMPMYHYTFERIDGGWRRTTFHITYHGAVTSTGGFKRPLSKRANRREIERITGRPYGYHWGYRRMAGAD
jgi:hypothetical protein